MCADWKVRERLQCNDVALRLPVIGEFEIRDGEIGHGLTVGIRSVKPQGDFIGRNVEGVRSSSWGGLSKTSKRRQDAGQENHNGAASHAFNIH